MKIIDSGENALSELIADILAVIIEDLAEISNILTPIYLWTNELKKNGGYY